MGTEMLERRLATIGARVKISRARRGGQRIVVPSARRSGFFEIRFAGRGNAIGLGVTDVARAERDLLLFGNPGHVRQGEWFFIPAPEFDLPVTLVLFDEPLARGCGKSHVMQFAYRRGGQVVWVGRHYPRGISDAQYRRLTHEERQRGNWSRMVRDADVFAKGAIRHPDHATVVLRGWHRVARDTEQAARATRHVALLD